MAGSPTLRRPFQSMVFPVRAEHRDVFQALIAHAKTLGIKKVAFLRIDTDTSLLHPANVKVMCKELGMELVAEPLFKSVTTDAQVTLNLGGSGPCEKVIRAARAEGVKTDFYAVNSGLAQMFKRWVSCRTASSLHK